MKDNSIGNKRSRYSGTISLRVDITEELYANMQKTLPLTTNPQMTDLYRASMELYVWLANLVEKHRGRDIIPLRTSELATAIRLRSKFSDLELVQLVLEDDYHATD